MITNAVQALLFAVAGVGLIIPRAIGLGKPSRPGLRSVQMWLKFWPCQSGDWPPADDLKAQARRKAPV
jgi:hypothetical protein